MTFPPAIDAALWQAKIAYNDAKFTAASHTKLETTVIASLLEYIEYLEGEVQDLTDELEYEHEKADK